MRYFYERGQLNLSDRIAIETGICRGESFKKTTRRINRHPTTVSNEVKANRTFIRGHYYMGKDCKFVRHCAKKGLCDTACPYRCCSCRGHDCREICDRYISTECTRHQKAPYVSNTCSEKKLCHKTKYFYSAKYADAAVTRRRSESRKGFRLTDEQFKVMDELITKYVKKGQPLTHIYAEHEQELPVCLRRKTGYRQRKGKKPKSDYRRAFREGRTYDIFLKNCENSTIYKYESVEMDTVKGKRESGKRLLTMIFRKNSVILLFLMPDGTAASVKRVFDYLEFIRYVIPRGKSLTPYTDEDMHELKALLEMDLIPADEVHVKPSLFKLN